MYPSFWQILLVLLLVVVLFGRGKISALMGDVADGIKSFKKGMSDDDEKHAAAADPHDAKTIDHDPASSKQPSADRTKAG